MTAITTAMISSTRLSTVMPRLRFEELRMPGM
jgi:hypothetical protein